MNNVLWLAQILLAGIFLYSGFSAVFSFFGTGHFLNIWSKETSAQRPQAWAAAIAFFEILCAFSLLVPVDLGQPQLLVRLAASALALRLIGIAIFRGRRKVHATPVVTLFMVALLVLVGRWP